MKDIVKGNDINILWDIVRKINGQDEPYDLTGRNLSLYLVTPLGQEVIDDFTTQGNTIIWTFQGMDQKVLGVYSLKLVINESQPYMQTVDECNVLRLVEHSCMAGGHDDEGIKVETISLIAHIDVAAIIPDTSLNANSQNVVTNAAIAQGLDTMHNALSQDIELSASEIKEEVKAVRQELTKINANKANTSGRYPKMSVGFSDDLVGRGESVPAEFSFRASGGKSIKDGTARIKRLKGNSVVWNQHVEKKYLTAGRNALATDGGVPNGHIFALIRSVAKGECYYLPSQGIYNYSLFPEQYGLILTNTHDVDNSYVHVYSTDESGYVQLIDLTQMFGAGDEPTTIEEYNARKPIVADEYAYNEGEVIHMTAEGVKSIGDNAWDEQWRQGYYENGEFIAYEAFVANENLLQVIPNETYYYSAPEGVTMFICYYDNEETYIGEGSVLSNNTFTIPANVSYINFRFASNYGSTYNHDILISLYHSGWKQDTDAGYQPYWQDTLPLPIIRKYFPDGMKSAGTAHDEIRFNKASGKWEYSKGKIKSVDLGDMAWSYDSANQVFTSYTIMDLMTHPAELSERGKGLLCSKYSPSRTYVASTMDDKSWLRIPKSVTIKDSSYTDAATFKEAMQGVILYYEAAEWEWVELDAEDQNFNLDYRVADFGTEEIIAPQPSAPLAADIIYQFNAVDMIREHELEITELQRIIATMQAQLTSLTNK